MRHCQGQTAQWLCLFVRRLVHFCSPWQKSETWRWVAMDYWRLVWSGGAVCVYMWCVWGGGCECACISVSGAGRKRNCYFKLSINSLLGCEFWISAIFSCEHINAHIETTCLRDILLYMPIWTWQAMECKEVCISGGDHSQWSNLYVTQCKKGRKTDGWFFF